MKLLSSLLLLLTTSATLCLANEAQPNLNDPATFQRILAEAKDIDELKKRGKKGEELYYTPDNDKPYTGWVKIMKIMGKGPHVHHLMQFKDGKLHGFDTGWHANGKMSYKTNYVNGKQHGLYTGWHENGKKASQHNQKDGKLHGLGTGWAENGRKRRETNHRDGKLDGLRTLWHENGKKSHETNYKDGKQHGLLTTWDKEGNITSQSRYENGKQVEKVK